MEIMARKSSQPTIWHLYNLVIHFCEKDGGSMNHAIPFSMILEEFNSCAEYLKSIEEFKITI